MSKNNEHARALFRTRHMFETCVFVFIYIAIVLRLACRAEAAANAHAFAFRLRRGSLRCFTAQAGGADRDRTDDLKLAKLALSQLSYGP